MIDNSYVVHQIARHRIAEMTRPRPTMRSRPGVRRRLARGLRKLADWVEPAFHVRIPTPRHSPSPPAT